jgi:TRAP transporter TAXI family solute receptor
MKFARKISASLAMVAIMATPTIAQEKLKMATIAPGSSAYLVMTTMASMVNSNQDDYEITVDATGAATKHMVEAAQGKLDVVMSSPIIYNLMRGGKAMYQKLETAPELSENLGLMFWFPYGAYHVVTYADSGIENLDDIRGKRVFLGPPGGGAYNTAKGWIKATTGMEPGADYVPVKASWGAGLQGFQDRQFDVYISGGIPPFPQVEQLSQTANIRILGLSKNQADSVQRGENAPVQKAVTALGRSMDVIPRGIYGKGVVNERDVHTIGSLVGVVARLDLSEGAVYALTKTFWENLPDVTKSAPYMEKVSLKTAFGANNMRLHPGALKYYKEAGVNVPSEMQ